MFNDDNTAHTQAASRFTPRGPSFILTDIIKLLNLLCYTPTLHQTSPTTQRGEPHLNSVRVSACASLYEDASPLGAKEKRADVTCRRQNVPVEGSVKHLAARSFPR